MSEANISNTSTYISTTSHERSSTTVHGTGYINMGPLTVQHYEIPTKCIHTIHRKIMNFTESSTGDNEYEFNVLLLGDSGVGKTCLFVRFNDEKFLTGNFHSTVGIDYRSKIVRIGNNKINLQIYDTAGQERFRSIPQAYYRDANALLLIYDVTSVTSFENISAWLNEIKEFTDSDLLIMLIGNKIDKSQRVISRESGERLARDCEIYFLETSAKTGQNVELAFMTTAQSLIDKKLHSKNIDNSSNDRIKVKTTESNYFCC
ncbi:unnamed protein product [Rotaria magnacalcarata]|uniref:Uncharacterized protein n=3 Tax=Rotaria magnacalcarata TaxID=392030 RepID=A0A814DHA1_9BILA|nr:unnamed protein product [Rotaria magnacalcarata]CAF1636881.1 unnamed protein product [Rotaria magnacalcarata]CAF2177791.1 unnamed protein product [Rotaria magnacalcarata]CAF3927727.1 unnamed protein product [Rotaria magnacalcarata]